MRNDVDVDVAHHKLPWLPPGHLLSMFFFLSIKRRCTCQGELINHINANKDMRPWEER